MLKLSYCWELGAGFGHIARIENVCKQVAHKFAYIDVILRQPEKAESRATSKTKIHQAPFASIDVPGYSPSYAHVLWRSGWYDDVVPARLVQSWLEIFSRTKPDLVILDHAPTAAVAASIAAIPYLHICNGFEIPPHSSPFPCLTPWDKTSKKQLKRWEQELTQRLGKVLTSNGKTAYPFQKLFESKNAIITTSPGLDHYERRSAMRYWQHNFELPSAQPPNITEINSRPGIFIYLTSDYGFLVPQLRALAQHFNVFGYTPDLPHPLIATLRNDNIFLSTFPLNMGESLSRCKLVLCHGGIGTCGHAISNRKALVVLPTQLEQRLLAFRLHDRGMCEYASPAVEPHALLALCRKALECNFNQAWAASPHAIKVNNIGDEISKVFTC